MSSSKISGSVEKIGSRVTHMEGNLRVEELVRITIGPAADQKKAFEKDPIDLIKRLLTQEGHKFREVKSEPGKPVSHLRSEWFHIVYSTSGEPACIWINITDRGW